MKSLLSMLVEKAGSLMVALFAAIMILQVFVGFVLDGILDLVFLAILTGSLKLDQLSKWIDDKK